MPAEPRAQASAVLQKVLEAGDSSLLASCPLVWEAAALLPAAPSQGLCYTLQMLTGEGVAGGDLYLSTLCQILLSLLAFTSQMASPTQPSSQALWCCQGRLPSHSREGLAGITSAN